MKKLPLALTVVALSASTLFGQGRVNFNNFTESLSPITIGPVSFSPTAGLPGQFAGANYSVQLQWAPGTFQFQSQFEAANPSSSPIFPFFGTTGSAPAHGPTVDGAGLFDGGTVNLNGPAGVYTMQVRAWFNGGIYPTYAAAYAAIANPGRSQLFTVNVTESPTPPPSTMFLSFQVGILGPEPSTFAIAGVGAVCLLVFSRMSKSSQGSSKL